MLDHIDDTVLALSTLWLTGHGVRGGRGEIGGGTWKMPPWISSTCLLGLLGSSLTTNACKYTVLRLLWIACHILAVADAVVSLDWEIFNISSTLLCSPSSYVSPFSWAKINFFAFSSDILLGNIPFRVYTSYSSNICLTTERIEGNEKGSTLRRTFDLVPNED